MSSREDILQSIRRNTGIRYEKPDYAPLEKEAMTYSDKLAQFQDIMKLMGGRAVILQDGEDVNEVIRKQYPEAKRIATCVDEMQCGGKSYKITCATFHPDDVEKSGDLNGTDLAILQGRVGVCENGAVWIQQDVEQRAIYFISEALVILLDRKNLVNNMHEAYKKIDTGEYGYGVFISGPSKTADIEQALVMGAHGACDVTVIVL
ncbi:LUD domain-containing protein [uncultured Bacteroides sp.]|uniref:LutC/YkgG family protein n=1 Tax=uncultured Bacteroides sp. TaxID=162156 RepID=UPI00262F3C03|nr:LUD domain-containing protein [uncultured Bacteroides sp.]